ncbi:MAG: hypothetical protein IJU02_07795 [Lachnospiraceae bacterium]|nr:hypothetical protein [Lachnospiraceae bacterium]
MYYEDGLVLCGASSYNKKFYFNEDFDLVPKQVKDELKIMCVLFTEDVGGTIQLIYDDEGNLEIVVDKEEDDILYDEIGSVLKVKQLQRERKELFESLETFYKVMVDPQ